MNEPRAMPCILHFDPTAASKWFSRTALWRVHGHSPNERYLRFELLQAGSPQFHEKTQLVYKHPSGLSCHLFFHLDSAIWIHTSYQGMSYYRSHIWLDFHSTWKQLLKPLIKIQWLNSFPYDSTVLYTTSFL